MRKITVLFSTLLILLISTSLSAQIQVPTSVKNVDKSLIENVADNDFSKEILKALDPGKSFTSPDKLSKLLGNNKDFVGNVLGVMNGAGTEDEKMAKVDALKSDRKDFIEKLLGEGKAANYYKLVKTQVGPLTDKFKLAKLFL